MMLVVGFVDPFVSANTISASLKKYGMKSVAIVQRTLVENPYFQDRFNPALFDETIFVEADDSIETIVAQCKKAQINYLFNGFDHSLTLTDQLSNQLKLSTANNIKTSLYRSDKLSNQQILIDKGIQRINQLEITGNTLTVEEEKIISRWDFPVILKPANGFGTTGFFECDDLDSFKKNLALTAAKKHFYEVSSYLAQEKLIGQECSIDTFSLYGKHHVLLVRKYQKEYFNGVPLPRQIHAVLPSDPIWNTVIEHVTKVLDAIDMQNGLCHTEVFLTAKGVVAIDINPRLPGASNASCILAEETYGVSHVDALCQILLNEEVQYAYHQSGRIVYLQNASPRIIDDIKVEKIKDLPSFKCCITNKKKGTMLSLPMQLSDTVAFVVLAHSDLHQLDQDAEKIFTLEKNLELF